MDTAPLDEPQGRLGDSERWMSWEPKAPLAVPDHLGDSTEDDDDSEEDTTDEDTSEIEPEVVADRKPVHADPDLADDEDSRDESKEDTKGRWRCGSYFRFESMDQPTHGLQECQTSKEINKLRNKSIKLKDFLLLFPVSFNGNGGHLSDHG